METFDLAVIGGGVVGCAALREFTLAGLDCLLLEAGADILSGASKGNSAILHTGFDAPPDTLEHACVRRGWERYREIHQRLGLPLWETGAVVVAWDQEQLAKLPGIADKAHGNGVADVRLIGREELREREPDLGPDALGGVLVPGESIIDAWSAPLAYAQQAMANGGQVRTRARVLSGRLEHGVWILETEAGPVRARCVVNAAGNFGDVVEAIRGESPFRMIPRKGQYLVYDKPAAALFNSILLPVPTKRTKGVVVCHTIFGNVLVGPTAEDQEHRTLAETTRPELEMLQAKGEAIVPGLAAQNVTTTYAALRPATQHNEYQVAAYPGQRWITLGGIRSTGLSASLGLAEHTLALYARDFGPVSPLADPAWPTVPNLAERLLRPYQGDAPGEMVCHCEMVTAREIEAALASPLPPGDMGGLRRRTRATMGRCQGYYCGHHVARLAQGRLAQPMPFEPMEKKK